MTAHPRALSQIIGTPSEAGLFADVPLAVPELVEALRSDLSDYTADALDELLGPVARAALTREQPWPAVRLVGSDPAAQEPLSALLAAFVLGLEMPRARLEAALPRCTVDGAARLGLVSTAGADPSDGVRARVELRPYAAIDAVGSAGWWVVSDPTDPRSERPLRHDHVVGVGGASVMLAQCTVRTPVDRVLDLGTGCGVQALHASRHARAVTATDTSARALAMASFTWALNAPAVRGVDLDLRRGPLLEPVTGERFQLVVSNPPFVVTPRAPGVPRYEYRDGGLVGDALVAQLVTGVHEVLEPGGVAQLLGNWEHHRGEDWVGRVRGWLEASDLDGWVVQREVQDPAEYAELWIRDGGQRPGPAFDALYGAWLDDFAARGVEAIGFGVVTLRRPMHAGEAMRRVEEVRGRGAGPLGAHLATALAAHDWLAGADRDALLGARLRAAPDVTEERHYRPGAQEPTVVLLHQGGGFARTVEADAALAGLVGACDGDLAVGTIVSALAVLLDTDSGRLQTALLPAVRRLVADGFLLTTADG